MQLSHGKDVMSSNKPSKALRRIEKSSSSEIHRKEEHCFPMEWAL